MVNGRLRCPESRPRMNRQILTGLQGFRFFEGSKPCKLSGTLATNCTRHPAELLPNHHDLASAQGTHKLPHVGDELA